jgi:hypothetical protein
MKNSFVDNEHFYIERPAVSMEYWTGLLSQRAF